MYLDGIRLFSGMMVLFLGIFASPIISLLISKVFRCKYLFPIFSVVGCIAGISFLNLGNHSDIMALNVLLLPLAGVLCLWLFFSKISVNTVQNVLCAYMFSGACMAWILLYKIIFQDMNPIIMGVDWINISSFHSIWSINYDVLTAMMSVLVMTVSFLVHIYSIGYMHGDAGEKRFFIYLSLFTFCMMMLINSRDFLQLFFGWEGVGLSSYLLIGYWFHKDSANMAAVKAFVTNRVGDLGLLLGVFLLYWQFDSIMFVDIFSEVENNIGRPLFLGLTIIDWSCLLLFVGCMGKSAQLGLHVWLPDAMEGPTPVSALIHAATMVTAGVFLLARCSPLFEYSEIARSFIVIVGAITCFFAATVAVVQRDIKKTIAYSTCSQLGYMMMSCGVSAYSVGVFHLLTHGFFKALLFLGAGSVIHAMSNEQDMYNMGGIYKKVKISYIMMWIGSLALAGFFPFAGYYSKDAILEVMFVSGNSLGYVMGMVSAFLTAFYSWKLLIMVFHGNKRYDKKVESHIHESPMIMLIPLFILALGAIFAGYLGYNLGIIGEDNAFWNGAIFTLFENNLLGSLHDVSWLVKYSPMMVSVVGIICAYFVYCNDGKRAESLAKCFSFIKKILDYKWFFDEIYSKTFVRLMKCGGKLLSIFDRSVFDGGQRILVKLVDMVSKDTVKIHTGYVYHSALGLLLGMLIILSYLYFKIF